MFGIGLPEMILIMAIALIVVGPDKLPDLARSTAKVLLDLKKTAEGLKESLKEDNPLDEIQPDLEKAARALNENLLETPTSRIKTTSSAEPHEEIIETITPGGVNPNADNAVAAYKELTQKTGPISEEPSSCTITPEPDNSHTRGTNKPQ